MRTLDQTVQGWTALGLSKPTAVRGIVASRLASNQARGHGNKAAKRAARIETNLWAEANEWYEANIALREIDVEMLAAIYDR